MKKFIFTIFLVIILFLPANIAYSAELVIFNTQTYKYHSTYCKWALKCTKNCIKIDKKEAIKRGGIPCKVCGG